MDKHLAATVLEEIALLLELKGENPFRIRAYLNAARSLENLNEELEIVINEGRLEELPGIGKDLAEKITTLFRTGRLPFFEKLKKTVPNGLTELMSIPGLGGRKIKALYDELKITSIEELETACRKGKVAELCGFGKVSQANILKGINRLKTYGRRFLWWEAKRLAEPILQGLTKLAGVKKIELAGSMRRKLETVGDLDFLVASSDPDPIMDWFTSRPWVERILAKGSIRSSIRLKKGLQADIRVVPEDQFAYALVYFTGSKDHNIKLRSRANARGLTLNEYSLEPLPKKKAKRPPLLLSEEALYNALGLSYIPPEIREDRGEIEAAEQGNLPHLIEDRDIKGVFHCHTTESDGHNTLEEMSTAASQLRWEIYWNF